MIQEADGNRRLTWEALFFSSARPFKECRRSLQHELRQRFSKGLNHLHGVQMSLLPSTQRAFGKILNFFRRNCFNFSIDRLTTSISSQTRLFVTISDLLWLHGLFNLFHRVNAHFLPKIAEQFNQIIDVESKAAHADDMQRDRAASPKGMPHEKWES